MVATFDGTAWEDEDDRVILRAPRFIDSRRLRGVCSVFGTAGWEKDEDSGRSSRVGKRVPSWVACEAAGCGLKSTQT